MLFFTCFHAFSLSLFYFATTFPSIIYSSSSQTTRESSTDSHNSLVFEARRPAHVKEIFINHLSEYTRFPIDSDYEKLYLRIVKKACLFAAGHRSTFSDVINDTSVSVPVHCFLLEFFVKVLLHENEFKSGSIYSHSLKSYSDALSSNLNVTLGPIEIFNTHVFPLLKILVSTGNFLNYSMLYSQCFDLLTDTQKDSLFTSHCRQYFSKPKAIDEPFELFAFKQGIDFMTLYYPRYDILNISGEIESDNKLYFYYVVLQPLRAVVNPKSFPVTMEVLNEIRKINLNFEDDLLLKSFEEVLNETRYINYSKLHELQDRNLIFNAMFRFSDIPKLIQMGLVMTFQSWAQFQYSSSINENDHFLLKQLCYNASDERFKIIFDELIGI